MTNDVTSNTTIAKNTLFLYGRMLLVMSVALYSSRVVLYVLGASDYGLYNVVGGVVTMLSFINSSMSAGTSRFLAFELGRKNYERLNVIFNVALVSHILIALLALVLGETVGLWFVNAKLQFPEERTFAVNVVYQMSILSCMLQFTQVPYNATIIAHERMNVYAYVGILEVILKLCAVFFLMFVKTNDSLIAYSILIFTINAFILFVYRRYCSKNFIESKWKFIKDRRQYKEIFSFSGWDVIGGLCVVTKGQGINILLNVYFGPVVNAARAICYQVEGAFTQFTNNFITAVNPEIVKTYARSEYQRMISLVNNASLFSYYLLLLLMMPVMFRLDVVLGLWLKEVPNYTLEFTLIILGMTMIRSIARPVIIATHATGDIKSLNLYAGGVGLLVLPVAWITLLYDVSPIIVFVEMFLFGCIANIFETAVLKKKLPQFSVRYHVLYVYVRVVLVTALCIIPICFFDKYLDNDFMGFCVYYALSLLSVALIIYYMGMPRVLRKKITTIVVDKLKKK